MIKKVAVIVALVMVASLSVAGCLNSNTKTTSSNIGSNNNPAVSLTVNSVTTSSDLAKYPFESTAAPGNKFVVVDLTLTNLNKNDLYMGNSLYFRLITNDGAVYSYSTRADILLNNTLEDQFHTNPGDTVTGQVPFEIPQSATPASLRYSDSYNPPVTTNL
jgi:hypothetical protein